MLSAASPVFSSAWQALQVGGELDENASLNSQQGSSAAIAPIEGGYVFGNHLATTADSVLFLNSADLDSSVNIADFVTHDSLGTVNLTLRDWSIYGPSGTGGFVGRIISPGLVAQPSPAVSEPGPNGGPAELVPSEGGLITINPIPGVNRHVNETGRSDSVLTRSPAGNWTPNAPLESNGAAFTSQSISGEWARAAVFEIAGGEPVDRLRLDKSQGDPVTAIDPFIAAGSTNDSAGTDRTPHEARRLENETSVEAAAEPASAKIDEAQAGPPLAGLSVSIMNRGGVFGVQPPAGILLSESARRAGSIGEAGDAPSDVAVEAAFHQIGEAESAIPVSSNERVRLDNWLSGAPLLLMLALERVAARNFRRGRTRENAMSVSRSDCG